MKTDIDTKTFWRLMGARPLSVPIVAARGSNGPAGLLALSVSHVSAAPPSLLVCVGKTTSALDAIKESRAFAVSYLPQGAEEVADTFGGRKDVSGAARFFEGQWSTLSTGAPVFNEAVATFDCQVEAVFPYEQTDIIVGRIVAYATAEDRAPLLTYQGRYRALTS